MEISSKVFKNTSEIDLIIHEAIEKKCQYKIQTNLAPVLHVNVYFWNMHS